MNCGLGAAAKRPPIALLHTLMSKGKPTSLSKPNTHFPWRDEIKTCAQHENTKLPRFKKKQIMSRMKHKRIIVSEHVDRTNNRYREVQHYSINEEIRQTVPDESRLYEQKGSHLKTELMNKLRICAFGENT